MRGDLVSTNFFETLGIRPIAGRTFAAEDDGAEGERRWRRSSASASGIGSSAARGHRRPGNRAERAPGDDHRKRAPRFAGAVLGESSDVWIPLLPYIRGAPDGARGARSRHDGRLDLWAPGARRVARSNPGGIRRHFPAPTSRISSDEQGAGGSAPYRISPSRPAACSRARATACWRSSRSSRC